MIYQDGGLRCGPAHALGVPAEQVVGFYAEHWNRPIALSRPDFYRWQFMEAPEARGLDHACVALKDGVMLGVMGLNPRSFRLNGETGYAAELTTWVVSEAARGQGVGRGIMTSLQGTFPLLFGLGISAEAMQIYRMAGFRHLRHIPRYFRIFDLPAVLGDGEVIAGEFYSEKPIDTDSTLGGEHRRRALGEHGHAYVHALGERMVRSMRPPGAVPHVAEPADAGRLATCEPALTAHANHFVRDAAALAWRYERHPIYRHEAFVVRSATSPGSGCAVVLRHDRNGAVPFTHLMDAFGDPADLAAAISFAEGRAAEQGSAFIDLHCTSTLTAAAALAADWFSTINDPWLQLSHLYYPPEFRPVQTTSAVMWTNHDRQGLFDFGRLYLTKEDLDLDRPTLAYYEAEAVRGAAAT